MGLLTQSVASGNALSGVRSLVARARDALRAFRGKHPKYSALARHSGSQSQSACFDSSWSPGGICTEADVAVGSLTHDGQALLQRIVQSTRDSGGPIIQFGTLLGEAAICICQCKSPAQTVIAVDPGDANPWDMSPSTYRALVSSVLGYMVHTGQVTHVSKSVREFIKTQNGQRPALVFLNYVRTYEEARQILQWARLSGAQAIAGRGYDYASSGIIEAVDEMGGPHAIEGDVWQLNLDASQGCAGASTTCATRQAPDDESSIEGLVSILVPAYNAREFIDSALHDVSRQLYRNWELIVVEDGSIDDVEAAIQRFKERCPDHRIVYHRKPMNAGVSRARNDAMELCHGEYVAFLDADDRWLPDHLQRKVRLLRRTGCDLAYSRVEMFDSDTGEALCTWGPTDEELGCFPESMFRRPYLQPSGVVVRRSLLADVGRFDEELAFAKDYDYWFRAIGAGKRFCFDQKVTSRYRKNHASAATTDRLVLCYDGIAEITCRHRSLLDGDDATRRRMVARHFLAAGSGHLAFRPSPRNGCCPDKGQRLLREAWRQEEERREGLAYYLIARIAIATGTTSLFRGIFRRKYKRCRA